MNGQALYRRWRSQTFDEVIAQEHVTRTLQNALRAERIAHAYLFAGPRGTGKTSTARILAKAANCLAEPAERPCNSCARCQAIADGRDLDLIEIDAASNRGIDEIRDLRDKIAFAPNEGRHKIYVIDEVHMLTMEAFNALLKTLEEPPPHVIFVLATTEPRKIPPTILSRCQRFDFRRIPLAALGSKIERICAAEGIAIQPAAIEAIARRAGGSFRDAESLLDQLAAFGEAEITLERVRELLGSVPAAAVGELVQAWMDADLAAGLRLINSLVDQGADARQLHQEVIEYLRGLLLARAGGDEKLVNVGPEVLSLMRRQAAGLSLQRLVDGLQLFGRGEAYARGDIRPQLPLELAFAQAILAAASPGEAGEPATARPRPDRSAAPAPEGPRPEPSERGPAPAPQGPRPTSREAGASPAPQGPRPTSREAGAAPAPEGPRHKPRRPAPARRSGGSASPASAAEPRQEGARTPGSAATPALLAEQWPLILQRARPESRMLEALLRSARPCSSADGRVVLEVDGTFHRDRLMESATRSVLEQILSDVLGMPCRVECMLPGQSPAEVTRGPDAQPLHEDPLVRYAVEDLGAEVRQIPDSEEDTADSRQS